MPKTQAWTPADGFTQKRKPNTQKPQTKSKPSIPPEIRRLIAQLKDKDPNQRKKTANQLAQMGEAAKAAIPQLIQTFKHDEDKSVIGVVTFALSQMGETAVPALIPLLEVPRIRLKVAKALRKIATPEALKAIEPYEKK